MTERRSDLLRMLAEYRPVDPDEQVFRMAMLDLAAAAHDPFDRAAYEPGHFTASGFVVHPGGASVLLVRHAKLERWVQPGGHIDPGDPSPIAAAAREVAEETGIAELHPVAESIVDIDIHEFPERGGQPAHRHFDLRFAFVAADPGTEPNHEVGEVRWVSHDQLGGLDVDRSIERPVGKVLGAVASGE